MIMDDEEIIRDVCGRMLTKLGYEVGFAKDGEEAIDLYRKGKDAGRPFNTVIMVYIHQNNPMDNPFPLYFLALSAPRCLLL